MPIAYLLRPSRPHAPSYCYARHNTNNRPYLLEYSYVGTSTVHHSDARGRLLFLTMDRSDPGANYASERGPSPSRSSVVSSTAATDTHFLLGPGDNDSSSGMRRRR